MSESSVLLYTAPYLCKEELVSLGSTCKRWKQFVLKEFDISSRPCSSRADDDGDDVPSWYTAIESNDVNAVRVELEKSAYTYDEMIIYACENNLPDMARLVYAANDERGKERQSFYIRQPLNVASKRGHLPMMVWLYEVASNCKNEAVRFLWGERTPIYEACDANHLHVVKWILRHCGRLDLHDIAGIFLSAWASFHAMETAIWVYETYLKPKNPSPEFMQSRALLYFDRREANDIYLFMMCCYNFAGVFELGETVKLFNFNDAETFSVEDDSGEYPVKPWLEEAIEDRCSGDTTPESRLELVKWIFKRFPKLQARISIEERVQYVFTACSNTEFLMAHYLWTEQVCPYMEPHGIIETFPSPGCIRFVLGARDLSTLTFLFVEVLPHCSTRTIIEEGRLERFITTLCRLVNVRLLRFLLDELVPNYTRKTVEEVQQSLWKKAPRRLKMLRWARAYLPKPIPQTVEYMYSNIHNYPIEMLRWLCEHVPALGPDMIRMVFNNALKSGNRTDICHWLEDTNPLQAITDDFIREKAVECCVQQVTPMTLRLLRRAFPETYNK